MQRIMWLLHLLHNDFAFKPEQINALLRLETTSNGAYTRRSNVHEVGARHYFCFKDDTG